MSLYVDIKKSLGNFQLNIQLEAKNEILALLGASGCGKSMTLKCIAGIEKPDEGVIIVDGITLFDSKQKINLSPQKRKTGLLFQNYALFPNMTVFQNIGIAIPETRTRVDKRAYINSIITAFQLDGLENRYPHQLSGGQQQRVALSRILASKPQILLLDEPFSALDSYLRWQLEQEISTHLSEFMGTTLFVSHNRDEVYRICDKISVVSNGKIEVTGDKWDLFKDPKTYAGSLLTGCKNISAAVKTSDRTVLTADWGIEFHTKKEIPEDIHFIGIRAKEMEPSRDIAEWNSFAFEIVREIQDTFTTILMIRPINKADAKPLRWEVSKTMYEEIIRNPKVAKISSEKILLLIE